MCVVEMQSAEEQKRARNRARYAANREQISQRAKEKYRENPEDAKRRANKYRVENAEKVRLRKSAYGKANRKKIVERQKKWREANRERLRGLAAVTRQTKRESILKHKAAYYERNKDELLKKSKAYRESHPEIYVAARHRRTRLKGNASEEEAAVIAKWEAGWRKKASIRCYWCDRKFPGKDGHCDHIVPLSKGGSHSVDNLCASCPRCNLTKNAKDPEVFNRQCKQPKLFTS